MTSGKGATRPIATWRFDLTGERRFCTRPWNQAAVLSDGTVVCACIDAKKENPLGDLTRQSFEEIWNGEGYRRLREAIALDIDEVPVCRGCPNRVYGPPPPEGFSTGVPLPRALFVESHIGCNLACVGCDRRGMIASRARKILDFDVFRKAVDALSPGLRYFEFHVGGENYLHPRAHEMVRYVRDRNPDCFILTSTNGHFFDDEERRRALVESGMDLVIFSVDGARQESYERYRVGGDIRKVFEAMREVVRLRRHMGRERPIVVWRYILFEWNDSPEEMEEARRIARDLEIDHLTWCLNGVAGVAGSKRYYAGSPHLAEIEHEMWDTLPGRLEGFEVPVDFSTYAGRTGAPTNA